MAIRLTQEFQRALRHMMHGENVFLTGVAGTGKSTLLSILQQTAVKKNIVCLAPTGVAALNIGGATIHSFFRFPLRVLQEKDVSVSRKRERLFRSIDCIVIDEISMVRADVLDAIDLSLRRYRNKDAPFGGVQMIFFGDILQLPPVVRGRELAQYFADVYGGPYFFNAKSFSFDNFVCVELTTIFRQNDKAFQDILNRVREGKIDTSILRQLNARYSPEHHADEALAITLCATNTIAANINEYHLGQLKGAPQTYVAKIEGKFDPSAYPTDEQLTLKVGTQVMLLKNNPSQHWVNGSLGVVTALAEDALHVRIGDCVYAVPKAQWEEIEYTYAPEDNSVTSEVVGTFAQYPVKMAWAITIHKSQGKTFSRVAINMGNGAFSHGQTYVALSRCRTLEGITLETHLTRRDIFVDARVRDFLQELRARIRADLERELTGTLLTKCNDIS